MQAQYVTLRYALLRFRPDSKVSALLLVSNVVQLLIADARVPNMQHMHHY